MIVNKSTPPTASHAVDVLCGIGGGVPHVYSITTRPPQGDLENQIGEMFELDNILNISKSIDRDKVNVLTTELDKVELDLEQQITDERSKQTSTGGQSSRYLSLTRYRNAVHLVKYGFISVMYLITVLGAGNEFLKLWPKTGVEIGNGVPVSITNHTVVSL